MVKPSYDQIKDLVDGIHALVDAKRAALMAQGFTAKEAEGAVLAGMSHGMALSLITLFDHSALDAVHTMTSQTHAGVVVYLAAFKAARERHAAANAPIDTAPPAQRH